MRRHGIRKTIRRVSTIFSFGVASLLVYGTAGAAWGAPDGITDEARQIQNLYLFLLGISALVFFGVVIALLYAVIRYRRRSPDEIPVQTHGSNTVEFIWTGIPVAIVLALFTYSFIVLQDVQEDADADDMTVDIIGFQFQWQFNYALNDLGAFSDPDSDESIEILGTPSDHPVLVLPVDERVEFRLISNDVIHSFYVRDFLYKLDVVPGRENSFAVTARETGEFLGACAELCGLDHALMRFTVRVVERDEFEQWVAEQTGGDAAVRER